MPWQKKVGRAKRVTKRKIEVLPVVIVIVVFTVSVFTTFFSTSLMSGSAELFKDQFFLSFLGSIAGLSIAIITLLYSNIEKIRDSIYKSIERDESKIVEINKCIEAVYVEIKANTIAIFALFSIAFFLIVVSYFDAITSVEWINNLLWRLFVATKITLGVLSIIAIADTMNALFTLIKITNIMEKE